VCPLWQGDIQEPITPAALICPTAPRNSRSDSPPLLAPKPRLHGGIWAFPQDETQGGRPDKVSYLAALILNQAIERVAIAYRNFHGPAARYCARMSATLRDKSVVKKVSTGGRGFLWRAFCDAIEAMPAPTSWSHPRATTAVPPRRPSPASVASRSRAHAPRRSPPAASLVARRNGAPVWPPSSTKYLNINFSIVTWLEN